MKLLSFRALNILKIFGDVVKECNGCYDGSAEKKIVLCIECKSSFDSPYCKSQRGIPLRIDVVVVDSHLTKPHNPPRRIKLPDYLKGELHD